MNGMPIPLEAVLWTMLIRPKQTRKDAEADSTARRQRQGQYSKLCENKLFIVYNVPVWYRPLAMATDIRGMAKIVGVMAVLVLSEMGMTSRRSLGIRFSRPFLDFAKLILQIPAVSRLPSFCFEGGVSSRRCIWPPQVESGEKTRDLGLTILSLCDVPQSRSDNLEIDFRRGASTLPSQAASPFFVDKT